MQHYMNSALLRPHLRHCVRTRLDLCTLTHLEQESRACSRLQSPGVPALSSPTSHLPWRKTSPYVSTTPPTPTCEAENQREHFEFLKQTNKQNCIPFSYALLRHSDHLLDFAFKICSKHREIYASGWGLAS